MRISFFFHFFCNFPSPGVGSVRHTRLPDLSRIRASIGMATELCSVHPPMLPAAVPVYAAFSTESDPYWAMNFSAM